MRYTITLVLTLVATLVSAPALQAQDAASPDVRQELRALVSGEADAAQADRSAVVEFLEREDVEAVAAHRGMDLDRVKDAVRTLDAQEAATLAERVQDAEEQLAGGDTFVVTSTTIIIALLVIILIIVA